MKFYASVRMDIRRVSTIKEGEEAIGNRTKVKIVKNKMAPPFKTAEFDVLYGEGISTEGSVIDMGLQADVIKKSGSWFTYEGEQLGQGRENVRKFLKDNPAITEEISEKIKAALGLMHPDDQFAEDPELDRADEASDAKSSTAKSSAKK